ncbi:hypothetical protein ACFVRB_27730 [Streptomyces nojiriensis]|uniref:hypothetical protein n=1 Tax=Streptomyces nojiriensis TaxID=66374 RepID=UPI0036DD4904
MIHQRWKQQLGIGERTGGRHRASGLTELLGRELRACGREVIVDHLHVHLPRVLKTPTVYPKQETAR